MTTPDPIPPTPPDPETPPPAPQDTRRRHWLPLVILPLAAVIAAALLIWAAVGGGSDEDKEAGFGQHGTGTGSVASFPTPPPVRFISPTPRPTLPVTEAPRPQLVGEPLPDFTLATLDGDPIALSDLAGEIVFLNFWATWCAPCEAEMPDLQILQDAYAAEGVRVIAVTNPLDGQTLASIRAFLEEHDLTLTVALEEDSAFYQAFGVLQIPTTFMIDRTGIVRFNHIGELHPEDIRYYLNQLLG